MHSTKLLEEAPSASRAFLEKGGGGGARMKARGAGRRCRSGEGAGGAEGGTLPPG